MGHLRRTASEPSDLQNLEQKEANQLKDLRKRMEPRDLLISPPSMNIAPAQVEKKKKRRFWFWQTREESQPEDNSVKTPETSTSSPVPPSHQFFHLHHMKTGGTSVSRWIDCGIRRFQKLHDVRLKRFTLSECSHSSYTRCISDDQASCRNRIASASVMNYCAPLSVSDSMDWKNVDAITMLRHPVDRVWSMYRYQTKRCFQCNTLTQVYRDIDEGNIDEYGGGVCLDQLSNHQMRNLQSSISSTRELLGDMTDEERIEDAVYNIQNRFVVVGILELLQESIKLFSYSFPWMAETLDGSSAGTCPFPHENSSPVNNRCGANNTHWDLPDHPDPETRRAIEEHNQLDIKVYEAALQHFEMQIEAYSLQGDVE